MDEFIKNGMKSILQDTRYSIYVVRDDSDILVGMFVFSEGIVLRKKDEYLDMNQFIAVEDFREEQDTLRMFRYIDLT